MMLDGIDLHGSTNVVALGITTAGDRLALGLWEGPTENAAVASALLADLVDRGLDIEQGLWFVIDNSKSTLDAVANFEFERLIDRVSGPLRRNRLRRIHGCRSKLNRRRGLSLSPAPTHSGRARLTIGCRS
jgi:putative transposase